MRCRSEIQSHSFLAEAVPEAEEEIGICPRLTTDSRLEGWGGGLLI